jgi:excisionase family DNA binding protein
VFAVENGIIEHGQEGQRFLGRREVAARLGVSPQTVTRWANAGLLPSILTIGGQRRYLARDIDALFERLWRSVAPSALAQPENRRRARGSPT